MTERGKLSDKGVVSKTWQDSPCRDCRDTWCCTHLPLLDRHVRTHQDWQEIQELAQYNHVAWGLKDNGTWTLYLNRPCIHLKESGQGCKLHGKKEQPWICKRFSPHRCWYRRAFEGSATLLMIQWDSDRLNWLDQQLIFDEKGLLVDVPDWNTMMNRWKDTEILYNRDLPSRILKLPPGPQETERDRDILKYRLNFPDVKLLPEKELHIEL